jgi:hypothetical protein
MELEDDGVCRGVVGVGGEVMILVLVWWGEAEGACGVGWVGGDGRGWTEVRLVFKTCAYHSFYLSVM